MQHFCCEILCLGEFDAPDKSRARFTNLIAEPDAAEQAVTEAVNDTLKAIAASLLMEQVLAPRFEFRPKTTAQPDLDYGPDGYDDDGLASRVREKSVFASFCDAEPTQSSSGNRWSSSQVKSQGIFVMHWRDSTTRCTTMATTKKYSAQFLSSHDTTPKQSLESHVHLETHLSRNRG